VRPRLQASEERKLDAGAWEYTRNLVLRYAELRSAAERAPLVPALAMCLKLSDAEQQRLAEAVRADAGGAVSSMLGRFF
jgi:hypothetical protein